MPVTTPWLPTELWLLIFRFATAAPASTKLFETEYHPFHDPPDEKDFSMLKLADSTTLSLVRVSREWRELALQFMYENIHLGWYGSRGLLESLARSARENAPGYGRWARRLELSVLEYEDPDHPVTPLDILTWCPNVEILVKWDDDLLPHSIENPTVLASIKRFDWFHARYRDGDHQFDIHGDDRSRGVDFLLSVVRYAPNLQYLSVVKRYLSRAMPDCPGHGITLPALTTLRVDFIDLQVLAEIETWSLPHLDTVILESCLLLGGCSPILANPGIRVVEMLKDEGLLEGEYIPALLQTCLNLEELNYYVEYVRPSPDSPVVSTSVRCIRLHSEPNGLLRHSCTATDLWTHIMEHFRMLSGPMFPVLERVVLHDVRHWMLFTKDPRLRPLLQSLLDQNCRVQFEDGMGVQMSFDATIAGTEGNASQSSLLGVFDPRQTKIDEPRAVKSLD